MSAIAGATPEELLARFGLQEFRPGQREAVCAALQGRDSLVVMPTGGGKSLCYQLPALAGEDLVVVVSPLIALMSDQVQRLRLAGVSATMLASGMADGHNERALREIGSGISRLALAAPERFSSAAFREALARRHVSLFVVDEAHCVSEWGHDFRPDYLRLAEVIESLRRPPVMAATATATPRVAQEIAERLGLRDPVVVRSGFDRANLAFDVVGVEGKGALARKWAALMHVLADASARPAIVYTGTRKDTDELVQRIAREGIAAVPYHAGMAAGARAESQAAFMDGAAEVVVATNAFGMGVDKADVHTVAHWALPTSLEAYYQEAGRGGRDGAPARALLLAARMDLGRLIRFITERETTVGDVRAFVGALREQTGEAQVATIGRGGLSDRERILLSIAERAGALELAPAPGGALSVHLTGRGSPRKAWAAIKAAKNRGWESYRSIERFITLEHCRRRQVLDHFGDRSECAPSGRCCDVCDPDDALQRALAAATARPRARARVRRPGRNSSAGTAQAPREPVDEAQFERLRAWRRARASGKPAYTVAADATLEEVLRVRPRTLDDLSAIRGIGPAFCASHGSSLLSELAALRPAGAQAG
jgi:ATP-dependent DNA helicase RecQ